MSQREAKEVEFKEHELIVSMTDAKGKIVYANDIFCAIAGYTQEEVMGAPHNIVRHPDMPRVIFKILWDTVLSGKPVTAFVKNKTKDGDYYWVKAYVAPILSKGEVVRITSYRRPISPFAKEEITKLYKMLLAYEEKHSVEESLKFVNQFLEERGLSYVQFIDRLSQNFSISSAEALKKDVDSYYIDHVIFKTNITRSIALGKKDIVVTQPCCCAFGKKLQTLEDMPFTIHASWRKVHHFHNHVHALMSEYVQRAQSDSLSQAEGQRILHDVEKDTERLFASLRDVIDTYVEEKEL